MEGEVSRIGAAGELQQGGGGVSYGPFGGAPQERSPIRGQRQGHAPRRIDLPEGLSAVAKVVIREEKDALLIPLHALRGSFDRPTVRVQGENGPEDRPVALGVSDDFWTVVTEGVAEGEMVVTEVRPPAQGNPYDFQ